MPATETLDVGPSVKSPMRRPSNALRMAFLAGRLIVDAMPKPREPKAQDASPRPCRLGGGSYRPRRKKLTGSIPLAVRKQMLAARLRAAGAKTPGGLVNVRQEAARRAKIRAAKWPVKVIEAVAA